MVQTQSGARPASVHEDRTPMGRRRRNPVSVANVRVCRKRSSEPVAIQYAKKHNARQRTAAFLAKRFERLAYVWACWRESVLRRTAWRGCNQWAGISGNAKGVLTDQIDYKCFSFNLWLLEERCGWREAEMRAVDFYGYDRDGRRVKGVWEWWLTLHRSEQIDVIRARRWYR